MLDANLLPAAGRVFSLGFLGGNADASYTVAGAFVGWIIDSQGADVFRRWYGGESLERITAKSWAALDAAFREWLRTLPMPRAVAEYARARFDRPGVWRRTCPHVVDALNRSADKCFEARRFDAALALYDRALERDSGDWHAVFQRARTLGQLGAADESMRALAELAADERAPRPWRDHAEEAVGDEELLRGHSAEAGATYLALAARTAQEDVARTLEVKALAAGHPEATRAVVELLIGTPGHPPDPKLGMISVAEWAGETGDALAEYLLGKNLQQWGEWQDAARHLDRAQAKGVPTARIGRELLRARVVCACVLDDRQAIERAASLMASPESPFADDAGGRRQWVTSLIARCAAGGH
jgi:tetratricopeptide (TPR) repeat protein